MRPGEKLYEEKLMAEEGLKKTRNELIHIGCPIPFEVETFLKELETLMDMAYSPDNLFELETYGESIWGDYGYSENEVAYGEFYINQQYQALTGIISVSDNTEDEHVGGIFVIYDEAHQEIYHQELNRNSEPIQIEGLNVSDKKWIRFELQFHAEEGAGDFLVLMSDFEFIK